jgi:DNA-binding NarL/FixJ family response regulator
MASGTRRLRVLLAHDDRFFLKRLMKALDAEEGAEIVGYASDGQDAVDLALFFRPDVVVMATDIAGIGGAEATRRIRTALPSSCVLLTSPDPAEHLTLIQSSGAVGVMNEVESSASLIFLSVVLADVMAELERTRPARGRE